MGQLQAAHAASVKEGGWGKRSCPRARAVAAGAAISHLEKKLVLNTGTFLKIVESPK